MAFGINRQELNEWKRAVQNGEIAFLTHYWIDDRFPDSRTVTKAGCQNVEKLSAWGEQYGLKKEWIDQRSGFPHFDLIGQKQIEILTKEKLFSHIKRFRLEER
ncbi:hypothetical protein ACH95_04385 [Bacillus glycinifermentans]|uniref:YneQ n=1 Tax=Bacillus glycinifermentans TaxID=1664069 RepID=A0A0J6E9D9_9BACI|nr:hypothetical protein [Bacillus glycinifermentans]ATH91826.1 hypothetical protein COP00_03680 [Bacillus glycinifermentans]KMM62878.1 hypothetical protein ACH95_04385 [Bacillus glycinifermentans]KRT87290.1 hypothetical protein AB447_208615 [Bacillus glycinifermentans]MEC0483467.1 hypothetical protein [Bacillus glycinifermentans]MEC0495027.1 hypothetical protein [Bacillus glycinifermentans]